MTKVFISPTVLTSRGHVYRVTTEDGSILIEQTRKPEHDACRALVKLGIKGCLEVWDHERPYHRVIIPNIERSAKLTVEETNAGGLRMVTYRPFDRSRSFLSRDEG